METISIHSLHLYPTATLRQALDELKKKAHKTPEDIELIKAIAAELQGDPKVEGWKK